jgi:hypothetical protein
MVKKKIKGSKPGKSVPPKTAQDNSAESEQVTKILGHRITAKDAGWRSPTLFVAPLKFIPIDPPEPLPKRRRRR